MTPSRFMSLARNEAVSVWRTTQSCTKSSKLMRPVGNKGKEISFWYQRPQSLPEPTWVTAVEFSHEHCVETIGQTITWNIFWKIRYSNWQIIPIPQTNRSVTVHFSAPFGQCCRNCPWNWRKGIIVSSDLWGAYFLSYLSYERKVRDQSFMY
jgi:hypothetical protein